jgi:hypothetical protein
LHIAKIVDDQAFKVTQLFDKPAQLEVTFGDEQILYQQRCGSKVDAPATRDQFLANAT